MLSFIRKKKKAFDASARSGAGRSSPRSVPKSSASNPSDGSSTPAETLGTGADVSRQPVGHQSARLLGSAAADARLVGGVDGEKSDHGVQQPTMRIQTRIFVDARGRCNTGGTGRTDDSKMSDCSRAQPRPPTTERAARSAARDQSKASSRSSPPNADQSRALSQKAASTDSPSAEAPAENFNSRAKANTVVSPRRAPPTGQPTPRDALATAPLAADPYSWDPAADSRFEDKPYANSAPSDAGQSTSSAPLPSVTQPQTPLPSGRVPFVTGKSPERRRLYYSGKARGPAAPERRRKRRQPEGQTHCFTNPRQPYGAEHAP